MPTTRKRRTRQRRGKLSMNSFRLNHLLCFMAGWHPPSGEFELSRARWLTWAEFMADWVDVREECLATEPFQRGGPNFAEQVLKTYGAKGPPEDITYDELRAAFAKAEDEAIEEILADVKVD